MKQLSLAMSSPMVIILRRIVPLRLDIIDRDGRLTDKPLSIVVDVDGDVDVDF